MGINLMDTKALHEIEPGEAKFPEAGTRSILGTIQQYFTIWCGHPDCVVWEDVNANSKAHAAKIAKVRGWHKTHQHGWICPKHNRYDEAR